MLKLKIKVKHLFALIVALGASFILLQLLVMPKVEVVVAKKHYEQGTANGKSELLQVIDASSGDDRWALIQQYMIENGSDLGTTSYDVIVGVETFYSNMVTSYPDEPHWTSEEKIKYLKDYLNGAPANGYLVRAAKQLALEYLTLGQTKNALGALEQTEQRLPRNLYNQSKELKLARARICVNADAFDAAERLLDELSLSSIPEASYLSDSIAKLKSQIVEQHNNKASSVSGTINRSDGKPMAGIGVFLRDSREVYHSLREDEPYLTMTDSEGNFSFKGVVPGSYVIYIGLSFDQIDGWTRPTKQDTEWIDIRGEENVTRNITLQRLIQIHSPVDEQVITGKTIKFEWEAVEGAAYYTLNGTLPIENGSVGSIIKDHIESNSIELPLETLYNAASGYSYTKIGDKDVPDPTTVLGYANPSSRFSWNVEAYDANGKLLTRSDGYRLNEKTMGHLPFFYLKEHTLTDADQLLLAGHMDDALLKYQADYERNEQDPHSLRMIVKLLGIKATENKQPLGADSIPYLEKLAGVDDNGNTLSSLIDYYGRIGNWSQVDRYYDMLNEAHQGKVPSYTQAQYGRLLLKQGKVQEGEEMLRQAQENDPSNRFIGDYIASVIYTSGNFDKAVGLANLYPERSYYGQDNPDWSKLVHGMSVESQGPNKESYFSKLQEALQGCFSGDQGHTDDWIDEPAFASMKAFITAVSEVD
ncbi:carboxypeptidase regulatory-like domain-containing protein [Paenibacillus sp. PR3]|uniref:Carboxypeptidase regulatory-like domain-containing protein n=1 Tax=Paenibacillus terricola TaxID=2763503 RepID=A0ABR8N2E2_9BACL|nr:carboxypeptidase regulatory-like domain-containing protein [Paenibacillus terricola]MBD3922045.1 carboxypeptidase regulatory-like domain-containing protein [Paenibacillus terricola]